MGLRAFLIFPFGLVITLSSCGYNPIFRDSTDTYTAYQPVEPIPVRVCNRPPNGIWDWVNPSDLLRALPHETMRLAIGKINRNGSISYTPVAVLSKDETYIVVLDYIKFYPRPLQITFNQRKEVEVKEPVEQETKVSGPIKTSVRIREVPDPLSGFHRTQNSTELPSEPHRCSNQQGTSAGNNRGEQSDMTLPVYLGIGLRLKATVLVHDTSVNLAGLFGLSVAAQEKRLTGSLQIQTLGISGSSITPLIPMPRELNVSTVQQAIQALATIKSKIYDVALISPNQNALRGQGAPSQTNFSVTIAPSIVGVDNYIGTPASTEGIISLLLEEPQEFNVAEFLRTLD
ncbi:MAG: hypothetical protein MRJ67_08570 [Nitrospirales bacterium]|nr:hypothetical protein [Nitrospirales bacterium]MDR4483302.1 hypothetical protein [Nitrospirales bacterium]